jgi:hypothetical protein
MLTCSALPTQYFPRSQCTKAYLRVIFTSNANHIIIRRLQHSFCAFTCGNKEQKFPLCLSTKQGRRMGNWRWVVTFMLRGEGPRFPLDRMIIGPRVGLDAVKRKISASVGHRHEGGLSWFSSVISRRKLGQYFKMGHYRLLPNFFHCTLIILTSQLM